MSVTILTESELRECAGFSTSALEAVAEAFTWLSEDRAVMPPIMHIEVAEHRGDVDIKSAYVRGLDRFAVKIASGFFGNRALGLPTSTAMVVVLSARTGFCEAVLLDNGYLTDLRTGLAGAVAARHLAPQRVETVGVVGSGAQARYQVHALRLVRDFRRLLVHGRDPERVAHYADEMRDALGIEVAAARTLEQLVSESQVVITTTPAREPLLSAGWLHPCLHVTAMGADLAGKQELDPEIVRRADRVICDRLSQCLPMGELQHVAVDGRLPEGVRVDELGELTSGRAPGREDEDQVTVADLTGAGVQDTAIAVLALEAARSRGLGRSLDS